jgi:hypothetical protein
MEDSEAVRYFQDSVTNVNISLCLQLVVFFCLNIVLKDGGMVYLNETLRSLQIIVHFALLKIILPANVMMINMILVQVAMYDILTEDGICSTCEI